MIILSRLTLSFCLAFTLSVKPLQHAAAKDLPDGWANDGNRSKISVPAHDQGGDSFGYDGSFEVRACFSSCISILRHPPPATTHSQTVPLCSLSSLKEAMKFCHTKEVIAIISTCSGGPQKNRRRMLLSRVSLSPLWNLLRGCCLLNATPVHIHSSQEFQGIGINKLLRQDRTLLTEFGQCTAGEICKKRD